jgi:NADH-quinone oxidoreductase subunit C
MNERLSELADHIAQGLPDAKLDSTIAFGELTVVCKADDLKVLLNFLRDDAQCRFVCLIDICGVDYPSRPRRFEIVYHLLSPYRNARIRVKLETSGEEPVPSAVAIFPAANWFEREAFDLYGVLFSGHPDLRRILTDYGFSGHPMRKDFPLTGEVEVRWDEEAKRVVYEPVKLVQEYRHFDALSPWEGTDYVLPGDEKGGSQ